MTGTGFDNDPVDNGEAWGRTPIGSPPHRRRLRLLAFLLVTALVAVFIGGWVYDFNARSAALDRAHAAYQHADCDTVIEAAAEADQGKVPWGSASESTARVAPEIEACRDLHQLSADWDAGRFTAAATGYQNLTDTNDLSPLAIPLWSLVQKSAASKALLAAVPDIAACTALFSVSSTSAELDNAFRGSRELRALSPVRVPAATTYDPAVLVSCAATFEKDKQTEKASTFYTTALDLKPTPTMTRTAIRGKVRTDIKLAKSAHPRRLPAPTKVSGTGAGPATVVIHNASKDGLDVVMSGTTPVLRTIKACEACDDGPLAPFSCPKEATEASLRVPAGTYVVAVRSHTTRRTKVVPLVGSWNLKNGGRYDSCFGTGLL